ncbi:phage tail domain-containing protein [Nocardiopsis sp. FR26]|uniref:phage tail domain-containing protein n=1 Tax=Nocardiopsis sp. FR26 TaxID=2605987 RepID=UPI00135CD0D0|nr:phage tail domain-containing protein [Nocardiopsis sp. FR26]
MPLIHLVPEPPPPPPREWPKVPTPPAKSVVWVGPDGTTLRLDAGHYVSVTGRAGFGAIIPDHITARTMSGAALMRDIRLTPRLMSVPLVVQGDTPEEYLAAYRALQRTLLHTDRGQLTPGTLRVEMPDGSAREIAAYYHGGLEPEERELDDMIWCRSEHPNLEFYAPDPAFQGPEVAQAWRIVAAPAAFYPIYPVRVTSSQLGGQATITNAGDLPAYPVWEIHGPGTPTISNTDTGESFGFTQALEAGQVLTVDTRPPDVEPVTGLTAIDSVGDDWWPYFDGLPDLWHLPAGTTQLEISISGATEDTRVHLTYRPRYLAGW